MSGERFGSQSARFKKSSNHSAMEKANMNKNEMSKKKAKPRDEYSPLQLTRMFQAREKSKGVQPYRIDWGDFSSNSVEMRSRGPGWRREEEVKRLARTPQLLYREEHKRKAQRKRELGPGTYDLPDPIRALGRKPASTRGVIDSLDARFKDSFTNTPPPGTYGRGGVPSAEWEEGLRTSPGNKGMLENCGIYEPPEGGSGLAPGTYEPTSSSIDNLLHKLVSTRGPYETFSTDRAIYNTGHRATGHSAYTGDGKPYNDHFLDKWTDDYHKRKGKFSKLARYPKRPTERMFLVDPVLAYKDPSSPSPGSYNPKLPVKESPNSVPPPFLTSSSRDDRRSTQFFTGNNNSCGVGRYDLDRFEKAQPKNGATSAFLSRTQPPNRKAFIALNERTRAKNVAPEEREHLVKPLAQDDILQKADTLLPCQKV